MASLTWPWAFVIAAAFASTSYVFVHAPADMQGDIWTAFASLVAFVVGGGVGGSLTLKALRKAGKI